MGLIVNFTTGAVQGFSIPGFMEVPVNITGVDEVTVTFGGSRRWGGPDHNLSGTIGRVTGDVDAEETMTDAKTGKMLSRTTYSLKCWPTQRLF
jgi:hypothetical protein